MTRSLFVTLAAACALFLSACSSSGGSNKSAEPTIYDFGIPTTATTATANKRGNVLIADVQANSTFDGTALIYRLPANQASAQAYNLARWTAPPAALITERLKLRAQSAGLTLVTRESDAQKRVAIELVEFSHLFTGERLSDGLVLLRVTVTGNDKIEAQRFVEERIPAVTSDAAGGAKALQQAAEKAIERIVSAL
jgi:cholesterol transport system auxiliary component